VADFSPWSYLIWFVLLFVWLAFKVPFRWWQELWWTWTGKRPTKK